MLTEGPNHAVGRLSTLLGSPVQQSPQPTPSTTTTTTTPLSRPSSASNSARNSAAAMGFPIYEPQSQRPYTPEADNGDPETLYEHERQQQQQQQQQQHPIPDLPATPAPAHTTTRIPTSQPQSLPPNADPFVPSSPNLASSPTLHGSPPLRHNSSIIGTPACSSKPSFQSHRTLSSTTSLERSHASNDPSSPFYLHPTTRTSLEVDRAGIKSLSASASKIPLIRVRSVPSHHRSSFCSNSDNNNNNNGSDLEASLSTLNPAAYPYPSLNSTYEKNRRERESVVVYPGGLEGVSRSSNVVTGGSKSCELLRVECQRRGGGRWKRLSVRQKLVVELVLGFWIVGGVVGLVVGLWWRFARLGQGS